MFSCLQASGIIAPQYLYDKRNHLAQICAHRSVFPSRANSLEAKLYSINGTTALLFRAVPRFVLVPLQNPPRVRQTSDLHSLVTLRPQLLLNVVHVHQDAHAAGTDGRKSQAELLLAWLLLSLCWIPRRRLKGIYICQELVSQNSPDTCQEKNLSLVQTFGQQLIYHLLDDQRAHESITT